MKRNSRYFVLYYIFFVLLSFSVSGQIDVKQLEQEYGEGEISLKKKIKISFLYNEKDKVYHAKISYRYDKLFINNENSYGTVQIPFNSYQEVNLERARFYMLDSIGEKTLIENVKVKYADIKDYFIEDIFYSDLKVKQFRSEVFLPESYLVSYSYNVIIKDLKFLSTIYFQNTFEAVKEIEIIITKNRNVDISIFEFNLNANITKTEDDNKIRFKANSLKRFKSKSSSVSRSYYLPHLIVSVKNVKTPEKTIEILSSTSNMYSWYHSLIKELSPNEIYIKNLNKSFLSAELSDEERIESIFKWVQNNIQYVAFEDGIAGFKPTEADKVGRQKSGDCKGMANLLVNMLKAEGYDARHAWIGTRNNNYNYSIPSLAVDNHMICALKYNDNMYYLDATSKSAIWTIPPPHLEGKEVLIGNNESYEIDTILISKPENNTISIIGTLDVNSDYPELNLQIELKGHYVREYIGYLKYAPLDSREYIPFYFINDYLDGIRIDNVTQPEIKEDIIKYAISGVYMNFVRSNQSITLFPFFNIIRNSYLEELEPPVYIDFPSTIEVDIEIINLSGRSINHTMNELKKVGNDKYFAECSFRKEGDRYFIHQTLSINILNSDLTGHEQWNSFINQIQLLNHLPISYDISK